ncbi:MAG: tRNA (adenosine(37)-N6)-threonylcarbamoyltransferase complex ATPase subunit type 1 TsaE [Candidatus Saccharibacteria bacterium]
MLQYENLDLKAVRQLAKTLAEEALGKDIIIGLVGDLGAGKTIFTQAFGKVLGAGRITSPTFIIVAHQRLARQDFYHIDFYRLKKSSELLPLGIKEILSAKNRVALIEWVDKFPAIRRKCDILVEFNILKNNLRNVKISAR